MLEQLKNKMNELKNMNKEDLKAKAKDMWDKSNELFNETSNVIKQKTDQAVTMYQDYQNRERETLPQQLATKTDREIKDKYRKICIKGDLMPGRVTIFETKVGGFPYLPNDMNFPKDANGEDMRLLAQIKCDDFANLENFPKQGMLQFFTSKSFNFGSNGVNPFDNTNFKIVYHKDVDKTIRLDDLYKKTLLNELEEYPIRCECPIYFTNVYDTISIHDNRYIVDFNKIINNEKHYREFKLNEIIPLISNIETTFIKVGGYPNFYAEDSRKLEDDVNVLLLQLETDNKIINTGKDTLIKFYIKEEDLKNLNFDHVFYIIENK